MIFSRKRKKKFFRNHNRNGWIKEEVFVHAY